MGPNFNSDGPTSSNGEEQMLTIHLLALYNSLHDRRRLPSVLRITSCAV